MHSITVLLLFALILQKNVCKVSAYRVFNRRDGITIIALENESVNIQCQTDMAMAYCGFIHPSGKRYSFSDSGGASRLSDGICSVKIKVSKHDSGQWSCHIGRKTVGVETIQTINLRVVGHMAAIQPNITVVHGKPVTLECATAKDKTPLKYCRFEPPYGQPFSISSAVRPDNPIMGRYYFPENMSTDRGDCAVTIRKVKYEDVGRWTCGAGLDDGKEHIDVIKLDVEGLYSMSTASATGIAFGVIGIAAFLCALGVVVWKKRRFLGTTQAESEVVEIEELRPRPRSPRSQRASPQPAQHIPIVITVQSPSEPSLSSNM